MAAEAQKLVSVLFYAALSALGQLAQALSLCTAFEAI